MWNRLILFFCLSSVSVFSNEDIVSSLNSTFKMDGKYKEHKNSIKLITERYRSHLLEIDIPQWVSKKHHESISTVILSEILRASYKLGNYKESDGIIECTFNEPENYSLSNFNYLVLINVLNSLINCDQNKDEKTIDEVVNKICAIDKYQPFSDKLRTAGSNIKTYMDGLKLYGFIDDVMAIRNDKAIDTLSDGDFKKKYFKLPAGIYNESCTCYFNSVLQLLYSIKKLRKVVRQSYTAHQSNAKAKMLKSLNSAFDKLEANEGKGYVRLLDEKRGIWDVVRHNTSHKNDEFKINIQNDAQDLFMWIIDDFRDELLSMDGIVWPDKQNKSGKEQQMKDYFSNYNKYLKFLYAKAVICIKCDECDYYSKSEDSPNYSDFPLIVLPERGDLLEDLKDQSCIDYKHPDRNDEKYEVQHKATKQTEYILNDLMPIFVKRYTSEFNDVKKHGKKSYIPSNFKETFEYCGKLYKLRSAIFHGGSIDSGHYIFMGYSDDGTAYKADDNSITVMHEKISESLKYTSNDKKQIQGYTETVLLYERVLWD